MDKYLFLKAATALTAVLVMTACSEGPAKKAETETDAKKEAPKPVEPVTATAAFWEVYKPARTWATDLQPLSITAGEVPGFKNEGGKAAKWTVVLVSPSRREARTFFYAIADQGSDTHKGVTAAGAMAWSGATPKSKPFTTSDMAVNSDGAYKAAYEKAEPWVKKHPEKKLTLLSLSNSSRFPAPTWYVMWGDQKSGYLAFVNATTGEVMGK